jgi:hypothetical protein
MKRLSLLVYLFSAVLFVACGGGDDSGGGGGGGSTGTLPVKTKSRTLAFPGADGAASTITGGAEGSVYIVNSLADDGSQGTLRAALQSGNRFIVFAVGGQINLNQKLEIKTSNITIAGQSAPGGGITVAGYPVYISGDNVIIRYMRFRMGDQNGGKANFDPEDGDALGGKDCKNVLIDHCSISWSTDECASFSRITNFTMQYCIISESLKKSTHVKGNHGYGGIWGGVNASYHHNLLACHDSRNPRFDHGYVARAFGGPIDYVNNVVYGWGGNSTYGGETGNTNVFHINMENNYYKPASYSKNPDRLIQVTTMCGNCTNNVAPCECTPAQLYISGNYVNGVANKDWDGVEWGKSTNVNSTTYNDSRSDETLLGLSKLNSRWTSGLTALSFKESAADAFNSVLGCAGASLIRDAVDLRVINNVRNGSGSLIDSQSDVGGYPALAPGTALTDSDKDGMPDSWEIAEMQKLGVTGKAVSEFKPNAYNITGKYTNLEVYLNELVKENFPSGANASATR